MGTFQVNIEIGDPQGQRWEPLAALVDTGSTFTWAPASMLRRLGVQPFDRLPFETADNRTIERGLGRTWVRYNSQAHVTIVVFGDEGSEPLLGAYTLEGFLLAVDPVNLRLVPIRALAK
jgi:predicted aspartyl protease